MGLLGSPGAQRVPLLLEWRAMEQPCILAVVVTRLSTPALTPGLLLLCRYLSVLSSSRREQGRVRGWDSLLKKGASCPTLYSSVLHGANGYRSPVCLGAQMGLVFGDPALPSV